MVSLKKLAKKCLIFIIKFIIIFIKFSSIFIISIILFLPFISPVFLIGGFNKITLYLFSFFILLIMGFLFYFPKKNFPKEKS